MWKAESGTVRRPSASCTHKSSTTAISHLRLFKRMRGSASRRCSRMVRPTMATRPAMPPTTKELMTDGVERPVDRPMRREKAGEMAEDHDDDAIVEQVRSKAQLPLAQQLGGIALPSIGLAIKTDQAADQQHREAEIGIDAEEKCIDVVGGQHVAISAVNGPAVFCLTPAIYAPQQDGPSSSPRPKALRRMRAARTSPDRDSRPGPWRGAPQKRRARLRRQSPAAPAGRRHRRCRGR